MVGGRSRHSTPGLAGVMEGTAGGRVSYPGRRGGSVMRCSRRRPEGEAVERGRGGGQGRTYPTAR